MNAVRIVRLAAAGALAAALLASGAARADHPSVKVVKGGAHGAYLADAEGRALYVFKKDSPGKSACAGECVAKWPLFYGEGAGPAAGLKKADFGTIKREDGKEQTTYKGMPLYYFAGDKAPAETNGQGVRDVWYLAKP
jgi:predicted lipoprotein with Yx(FWY)xxD motif